MSELEEVNAYVCVCVGDGVGVGRRLGGKERGNWLGNFSNKVRQEISIRVIKARNPTLI